MTLERTLAALNLSMPTIETETICPACLERYAAATFDSDYPYCPECSSEAMDFDVVPLGDFLNSVSARELNERLLKTRASAGLTPQFKQLLIERLTALIQETGRAL